MTANALKATLTLRKNFGSLDAVTKVFYLERSNSQIACRFHSLYGPDYCDTVSVSELDARDESDRRLPRDRLNALLEGMAAEVTGEWAF